jgi:hypothetical protein
MSIIRCDRCGEPIDTDKDAECDCEFPWRHGLWQMCQSCRELEWDEHDSWRRKR